MKFKGKLLLIVGIMMGMALAMSEGFINGFSDENPVSSISALVVVSAIIIGGIVLMIIGRNE